MSECILALIEGTAKLPLALVEQDLSLLFMAKPFSGLNLGSEVAYSF